jgi:hypothetical protein
MSSHSWSSRHIAGDGVNDDPRNGLLLLPRRKAYQPKGLKSPPDKNWASGQIDQASPR